jgi:hypothetical protein
MTIGGYDLDQYAPNTTLSWNPLVGEDPIFWSVELTSLSLGGERINLSKNEAIIDSGTSFTIIPLSEFTRIIEYF